MTRNKRLEELRKIPDFAAVDHRFFLDAAGNDSRLSALSRKERREIKAEGRKIGKKYGQILLSIRRTGVGYPVDQILRDLAIEYTHRYASSGVTNQPVNFNYFEAFCAIKLIEGSVAPYAEPMREVDHLFNVADFFDYLTSEDAPNFKLSDLYEIPEGLVHHFTQNGSIVDFTYMTAEGREFVISGFSMVRRGNSLHWYVLGGEVLSETEWLDRAANDIEIDESEIPAEKRPFLSASMKETGKRTGAPVALQGTKTAIRTIIAGETDLDTSKHTARCCMTELENSFMLFCDDPETVSNLQDETQRNELIATMMQRVEDAAVMWDLAEAFFQLPSYFAFRLTLPKGAIEASGKSGPKIAKGGRGVGTQFKYVSSIEISDVRPSMVRAYMPPHFAIETEGHWKRLLPDQYGRDRAGNQIRGRTWIRENSSWRARPDQPRAVYIKSSVAAAKLQVSDYLKAAENSDSATKLPSGLTGVLYVMRCLAMSDEVYKVGWTSNSAEQRARELSSATGVPVSFAVVEVWQHDDPEALERGVHAMLNPYRLSAGREFFKLRFSELKAIIETEITRSNRNRSS